MEATFNFSKWGLILLGIMFIAFASCTTEDLEDGLPPEMPENIISPEPEINHE